MSNTKKILLILILFVSIVPVGVFASNDTFGGKLCIENHLYTIDLNKLRLSDGGSITDAQNKYKEVSSQINRTDIDNKYFKYDCSTGKDAKGKDVETNCKYLYFDSVTNDFRACKTGKSTKINNVPTYVWYSCPVNYPDKEYSDLRDVWYTTKSENLTSEFVGNKWKVTLTGLLNVKISLVGQNCSSGSCLFSTGMFLNDPVVTVGPGETKNSSDGRYTDVSLSADGSTLTFYTSPGEQYYILLNLNKKGDICDSSEVYHFQGVTSYAIPNKYKNSDLCNTAKNINLSEDLLKGMIPECFTADEIDIRNAYTEIGEAIGNSTLNADQAIKAMIQKKIERANNIATIINSGSTHATVENNNSYQCDFSTIKDLKTSGTRIPNASNNNTSYVTSSLILNGTNGYWNAVCSEKIDIMYNNPREISTASKGFIYPIDFAITRTCNIVQVKAPEYKPVCNYGIECWGGPANHHGEGGAGPNDVFDECVKSCDNGVYSQECINSCYQEVYGNGSKAFTNLMSGSVVKLAKERIYFENNDCNFFGKLNGTKNPISSCLVQTGNANGGSAEGTGPGQCTNVACTSTHGKTYTYLDGCNARGDVEGTKCYEVFTSAKNCLPVYQGGTVDPYGRTDISLYVAEDYNEQVKASHEDLENIKAMIKEYKKGAGDNLKDKFNFTIVDDYSGEKVPGAVVYLAKNLEDLLKGNVVREDKISASDMVNYLNVSIAPRQYAAYLTASDSNGLNRIDNYSNYEEVNATTITKYYRITLPNACLSAKDDQDVYYTNDDQCNTGYNIRRGVYYTNPSNPGVNNLPAWPEFRHNGGSVLQKDLLSGKERKYDYSELDGLIKKDGVLYNPANIKLDFTIGTWNEMNNDSVECFYGITTCSNSLINTCPGNEDGTGNPNPNPNPNSGEGQKTLERQALGYSFRTVDLENMFPERDSRYNWSESSDIKNSIEKVGYDIYNENPDYTIKVTKQQLNELRKYNKNAKAYNDYRDMNCFTYTTDSGESIYACRSKLYENASGAYGDITRPASETGGLSKNNNNIIGCNDFNSAGQCIDYVSYKNESNSNAELNHDEKVG